MKNLVRNILILILPFALMIMVNEAVRPTIKEKQYKPYGVKAINSANRNPEYCSWNCHNDTNYCKSKHVKYLKNYFSYTDPLYFGVIHALKASGSYQMANIVFLVLLIPILMWIILVKIFKMQTEINRIKRSDG